MFRFLYRIIVLALTIALIVFLYYFISGELGKLKGAVVDIGFSFAPKQKLLYQTGEALNSVILNTIAGKARSVPPKAKEAPSFVPFGYPLFGDLYF